MRNLVFKPVDEFASDGRAVILRVETDYGATFNLVASFKTETMSFISGNGAVDDIGIITGYANFK